MDKVEFTVEFAGIPILIRSGFERNRELLRDYWTDHPPMEVIEPTPKDLILAQQSFDQLADALGEPRRIYEDATLEYYVIHTHVAQRLLSYQVLMIHGSAICMDGEAYIFTAPSGTGKSTHTRLWRETFGERCFMINDDKPLIRFEENGVFVYGTPWAGKHFLSRNASAPLKAIVQVNRSETNRIEPLSLKDAFLITMKQVYMPRDPAAGRRILQLEKMLTEQTAYYALHCNMDPDAAITAWSGINKKNT